MGSQFSTRLGDSAKRGKQVPAKIVPSTSVAVRCKSAKHIDRPSGVVARTVLLSIPIRAPEATGFRDEGPPRVFRAGLRPAPPTPTGGLTVQRCGGRTCPPGGCHHGDEAQVAASRTGAGPAVAPNLVRQVMAEPGGPLPPTVLAEAEHRFNRSFSAVRIHADSRATSSATAINARAYTVGSHIAFAAGEYQPRTRPGWELLAHELAHVVQQSGVTSLGDGLLPVAPPGDSLEREAEAAAAAEFWRNGAPVTLQGARPDAGGRVQRQAAGATTTGGVPGAGGTTATTPSSRAPVAGSLRSQVGTLDYYRFREGDFLARHPRGHPPDYYRDYGDRYVHVFHDRLRPSLSPAGQGWLDCTLLALQAAMENRRDADPVGFTRLEEDNEGFKRFAYGTHPAAYVNCGICNASIATQVRVLFTPRFKDLFGTAGIRQVAIALAQCGEMVPAELEKGIHGIYSIP